MKFLLLKHQHKKYLKKDGHAIFARGDKSHTIKKKILYNVHVDLSQEKLSTPKNKEIGI